MSRDTRQMSPEARTQHLLELGNFQCVWCGYDLTKPNARPVRELLVPKVKGGPTRLENEVASCSSCNQKRGHSTSPSQYVETCLDERGLEPNAALVADQLDALDAAIQRDGGMRKIRDYVTREAKRVRGLVND